MSETAELLTNALGRKVPKTVNGKPQLPFRESARTSPKGASRARWCAAARTIRPTATSA